MELRTRTPSHTPSPLNISELIAQKWQWTLKLLAGRTCECRGGDATVAYCGPRAAVERTKRGQVLCFLLHSATERLRLEWTERRRSFLWSRTNCRKTARRSSRIVEVPACSISAHPSRFAQYLAAVCRNDASGVDVLPTQRQRETFRTRGWHHFFHTDEPQGTLDRCTSERDSAQSRCLSRRSLAHRDRGSGLPGIQR